MNSPRLLVLSLLLGSCASTSAPVTYALAPLPPEREVHRVRPDTLPERSSETVTSAAIAAIAPTAPTAPTALGEPAVATGRLQDPESARMPANRHKYSLGAGVRFRDGDSAVTLSGNYRYWINEPIEIGVIADWAGSPIDTLLIAPAVWWHPNDRLTVLGAPGWELESGEDTVPALRLGAAYRLMLEKTAIRPFFYYDIIDDREDSVSFGISIGI